MNAAVCGAPLDPSTLLAYWFGELDADAAARIEQHYLGCGVCSRRLDELAGLAEGIRALTRTSAVSAVVSVDFVRRLRERGLRVREYRVACNGSVNCTVAPDDDFVVAYLDAPLDDVTRLDLIHSDERSGNAVRHADIPFDPDSGTVAVSTRIAGLRELPVSTHGMRLLAVTDAGERVLGDYTFHHTPYRGLSR